MFDQNICKAYVAHFAVYPVQGRLIIDLKILIKGLERVRHSSTKHLQLSFCIGVFLQI